jgi:ribosomal protein S18 acetylase RimI-like enzyme
MHIAPLQPSDATRYRALMLEAYALAADAFTSTPQERAAEPEAWWVRRITDAHSVVLGAFEAGELIGSVALEFSSKPKTRHKAHVLGMYVKPAFRATGAGSALLNALFALAAERSGIQVLNLTVTEGNDAAIQLYRSHGFEAFGTEPMAILTPAGFKSKVHMWRRLQDLPLDDGAP